MLSYVKHVARHEIENGVFKSKDNKLDIIVFSANWCGPCKTMVPILEKLAHKYEYKADIYKMDIDDEPDFCFMLGIKSVPTIVFFKNGKRIDLFVGSMTELALEQEIIKYI